MLAGWLDDCECFADDLDIVVGVVFTIVGDSVDADDSFDRNIVPYCVLELSVLFLPSINSAQCVVANKDAARATLMKMSAIGLEFIQFFRAIFETASERFGALLIVCCCLVWLRF